MVVPTVAQAHSHSQTRVVRPTVHNRGGTRCSRFQRLAPPRAALPASITQQEVNSDKLTPTQGRVLVKPEDSDTGVTKGGVLLASSKSNDAFSTSDAVNIGSVLAVGDGVEAVGKGDRVLYSSRGATEVTMADGKVYLCREEQVIAKVK